MKRIARLRSVLIYLVLAAVLAMTLSLTWLRWESSLPRDEWFTERQGRIESVVAERSTTVYGQLSESVSLLSDSGLRVSFRVIRNVVVDTPLPVLVILGGHRTGSDAVDLFGDVGDRAVVGVDYPYDGPEKARGVMTIARTIPLARQAFLDTTPAISLIFDWLVEQDWADRNKMVVIGASLGVPFAAAAAARDERISGVMLVHGAADNRLWFQVQVARRIDAEFLHYPLATVLNWLAYGPLFDTGKNIAAVSPRPVLIIGARHDERAPPGQTEVLFDAAHDPKRLRWTEGRHVQPGRTEIIAELLRIAEEELPFLTQ
ncbi:MAG: prolyl oligopeptidase family serine peptidase [Proteobacteria bacterium]|nr:prolyl oligopeptidase family serine peptidase [Pseudomonadota bacterium]